MEQNITEQKCQPMLNGRWTKQEHNKFLEGIQLFGKNWKKIQSIVKTRSGSQIRSHAQKFFNKLERKYEKCNYLFSEEAQCTHTQNQSIIIYIFSVEILYIESIISTENNYQLSICYYLDQSLASFKKLYVETSKPLIINPIIQQFREQKALDFVSEPIKQELNCQSQMQNCKLKVLKSKIPSKSYFFHQIWKYPQQIIKKNFIGALVDLKSKRILKNNMIFQQTQKLYDTFKNQPKARDNPMIPTTQLSLITPSQFFQLNQQTKQKQQNNGKRKNSFVLYENESQSTDKFNSLKRYRVLKQNCSQEYPNINGDSRGEVQNINKLIQYKNLIGNNFYESRQL